jgi:hypothetical protein
MAREITESVYQNQNRYTIEERFSDFQAADGLTIPTHYHLQYTQEVQTGNSDTGASITGPTTTHSELLGSTRVYDWDMTAERIQHNLSLDEKNFRVK